MKTAEGIVVASLHRPGAVSGVASAGRRASGLAARCGTWRPVLVGPEVSRAEIEASPLRDARGLAVVSWDANAGPVEQVLAVREWLRGMGARIVVPNDVAHGFVVAGLEAGVPGGLRCGMWMHADSFDGDELVLRCGELAHAWRAVSASGRMRVERVAREAGLTIARGAEEAMPALVDVPREPALARVWDGRLSLLYCGRLEKFHKRVLDLARLATALRARGVPFVLRIAGEGGAEQELRAALGSLEDGTGRVEMLGRVELSEVGELVRGADLGVLVSGSEGMPTAVMEAMAFGRGVAITRGCGGAVDAVRDGVDGVVVDVGDMEGLAARLEVLAREPELIARMGRSAHQRAAARFSREALAPVYQRFVVETALASDLLGPHCCASAAELWARVLAGLEAIGACSIAELERLRDGWAAELRGRGVDVGDSAEWPIQLAGRLGANERRMAAVLKRLTDAGVARIGLYGAGRHTVKVARAVTACAAVVAMVDDRAGPGQTMLGLPVVTPEAAKALGLEAVVISSDEHEREMRVRARGWSGAPVHGVYFDDER